MDERVIEARILAIDDEPLNLRLLERMLVGAGWRPPLQATAPEAGLELVETEDPDLLLLDLKMPRIDGFEVLAHLTARGVRDLPVIVLTADPSPKARRRALELGAVDFLLKPFDAVEVMLRIRNTLTLRLLQRDLEHRVRDRTRELEDSRLEVLQRLAAVAEFRDATTEEHNRRVGRIARAIADGVPEWSEDAELVGLAARLHDVGKVAIPDATLLKPGPLDAQERAAMERHPSIGSRILAGSRSPLLRTAAVIAAGHHERWDGSGYPGALAEDDIPWEARVTAVADVFDALTHERPYKPAWPVDRAREEICRGAGTHFDPLAVEVFLAIDRADLPNGSP